MTLRHLKIFVTVFQQGSVTKASEKLFLAQPSVSLAIKELERHYNCKLFEKFGRRLKITPKGLEFYQYAQRIISNFMEMEFSVKKDTDSIIRLGTGITIANLYLSEIIEK